ncbi:MAG: cytochrome c biogenesis protein CcsA [Gammaproteobacteria bacterium]|jgi:ABC-type uncharacterized transport system permease subunit
MTATLPGLLAIVLYLLASALLLRRLMRGEPDVESQHSQALLPGLAAVIIHGSILYPAIITASGLNLGIFYAASLVTMTTALLLLLATFVEPVDNLGIPVFPVAAICIGLTMIFPQPHIISSATTWQLDLHILASLLAYSILGLAVLQALLFAIQDQHLRNRNPGGFIRSLPPLQTMESLLFQMIATGFALLTLALISGTLFLEDIFAQHLVHKTVLSFIAWIVFAILLWGRWRFGWRGRVAIRWTIGGFIFLMLAYFGSKFVLELVIGK